MKLHRLVLRNYRGITHRDIDFPDRGVVVVSGANEIGKSSMIEALDLLLESKDRSTKKEVKQVKPTHVDEATEITAEISTGAYRFEYHKRFHDKPQTHLTVLSPVREQCTGDEAHDRVRAILADTLDTDLWQAQRVLQSAATAPVDLSGSDALARALDVAAGQGALQSCALSGSEPLLIDRIDAESRKYFTPTGRPTATWSAAISRLRDAEAHVVRCQADVDEVDEAVVRHARLTGELAHTSRQRVAAAERLAMARAAAGKVKELTDRRGQIRALADGAEMARAASEAALAERRRLRAELDERAATITELEAAAHSAAGAEVLARESAVAAESTSQIARSAVADCQVRLDAARCTVDRIVRRSEAQRVTSRLARIDAVAAELSGVDEELAGITLSDEVMRDVELAVLAVERAAAQAESASARVELDAVAGVQLMVDGQPVELSPGASWSQSVTTSTEVGIPGMVTVRVVPGAPAAVSADKLARARQLLAVILAEAGVADVAAARALDARRRELAAARDRVGATRDALLGDDTVDALRARLVELSDVAGAGEDPGTEVADAALVAATDAHRQARADHDARRDAAATAATHAAQAGGHATVLRTKLTTARDELTAAAQRLARQRDSVSDDQLCIQAEADHDRALGLAAQVLAVDHELAALGAPAVAAELECATRLATELGDRHDDVGGRLREVTAQMRVYGSQGRTGRLDDARAEREHAMAEHARVHRSATAAKLLQSVMARHRDQARLRYVDPFRTEVERLGRIVFGSDFEVEIDGDLRICSRTLQGRTVPYESLSGGAREQLGIVARLAGAALVAKEDGVPVVIDDALGFSDADRLAKMGEVFDAVGGDGQVIVLTCSPERYAGIGGAQHIELGAQVQ